MVIGYRYLFFIIHYSMVSISSGKFHKTICLVGSLESKNNNL